MKLRFEGATGLRLYSGADDTVGILDPATQFHGDYAPVFVRRYQQSYAAVSAGSSRNGTISLATTYAAPPMADAVWINSDGGMQVPVFKYYTVGLAGGGSNLFQTYYFFKVFTSFIYWQIGSNEGNLPAGEFNCWTME
jgi:hypothetical protein